MDSSWVSVRVLCRRCRRSHEMCVKASTEVPVPLQCQPSGGRGHAEKPELSCPHCSCGWSMDVSDLVRRVDDTLRLHKTSALEAGAVVLDLR